jgi:hypothetical protein
MDIPPPQCRYIRESTLQNAMHEKSVSIGIYNAMPHLFTTHPSTRHKAMRVIAMRVIRKIILLNEKCRERFKGKKKK